MPRRPKAGSAPHSPRPSSPSCDDWSCCRRACSVCECVVAGGPWRERSIHRGGRAREGSLGVWEGLEGGGNQDRVRSASRHTFPELTSMICECGWVPRRCCLLPCLAAARGLVGRSEEAGSIERQHLPPTDCLRLPPPSQMNEVLAPVPADSFNHSQNHRMHLAACAPQTPKPPCPISGGCWPPPSLPAVVRRLHPAAACSSIARLSSTWRSPATLFLDSVQPYTHAHIHTHTHDDTK
jgi:hypothetical protein